jgi:hypothetical protein
VRFVPERPRGRMVERVVALGLVQAYTIGAVLHVTYLPADAEIHVGAGPVGTHGGHGPAAAAPDPMLHFLLDSTLSVPVVLGVVLVSALVVRRVLRRRGTPAESVRARLLFAVVAAAIAAAAAVPEVLAHGWLFDEPVPGGSLGSHLAGVTLLILRWTFALTLGWSLLFGVPWAGATVATKAAVARPR